jgi:uncharacterized protein YdaU (DUF1376 family)
MHYYQFNIGDHVSKSQHLDPMEDLAYRRMKDLYYSREEPLPNDIDEIARLIRMRTQYDSIATVLRDCFTLHDDKYRCQEIDDAISKYQSKSDKARASANARWKKKPNKTKTKPGNAEAMRTHSEGNANHKPITTNQEPIYKLSSKLNLDNWPVSNMEITEEYLSTKKRAKGSISQTVINDISEKLIELRNKHQVQPEIALKEAIDSAWRGFKVEWVVNKVKSNGKAQQQAQTMSGFLEDNDRAAKKWLESMEREPQEENDQIVDGTIIDV